MARPGYALRVLIAASRLINALLPGGDHEVSLSRRAALNPHHPGWRCLGWLLEAVHRGHLQWTLDSEDR